MRSFFKKLEALMELGGTKKDIVCLILSGIALLICLIFPDAFPISPAWVAIILCGVPIVMEAIIGLATSFDIKADVLVSIALVASVAIREDFAAGEVAFIMQLGALLEDLTVEKARAGIEKLVHLTPQTARILGKDGTEKIIPSEEVQIGAHIRVLPGEAIPVDGVILKGETSVNQAVMTGESLPVDKGPGDTISSGTVNQFGTFEMEATKVGEDSSIQRMIRLVQSADAGKAKIVGLADRWATWIVVIALAAAALTWIISGQIIRAVTILVVFCPCALVLATPTAIMAAIGNATKHGFLVREGDALERLAAVSRVCFDKTGTLTYGTPKVTAVHSVSSHSDAELYAYAASAEQFSEHPLGKAIVHCFQEQNGTTLVTEDFALTPGKGVSAVVNQTPVLAGNAAFLQMQHIAIPNSAKSAVEALYLQGCTIVYVAIASELAGYLVLADTIRPDSKSMLTSLREAGASPVLLTGDHKNTAEYIAGKLGIQEVHAQCLPEDKLHALEEIQQNGQKVCMIGDGINDAPALKKADVGIAMGGVGSDIAVDAADIVLAEDDIRELPHLLSLSKRMMTTIKCNLTFSMTLNFVAIALAISGILNPVIGALVHNAGSVLVIINSAFLLRWRKR